MKYKVHGYAFCPLEVCVEVEAETAAEACTKAKIMTSGARGSYVVPNSSDEDHWFDWDPTAEPLENKADHTH